MISETVFLCCYLTRSEWASVTKSLHSRAKTSQKIRTFLANVEEALKAKGNDIRVELNSKESLFWLSMVIGGPIGEKLLKQWEVTQTKEW